MKGYGLNQLDQDGIRTIHNASIEVLEKVGLRVDCDSAFEKFKEHGCHADPRSRVVRIPEYLVDDALGKVPSRVVLYGRSESTWIELSARNAFFGTGAGCPYIRKINGEREVGTKKEAENCVRIADYLNNVDFVMACVLPFDQPPVSQDLHEFELMAKNTVKPMVAMAYKGGHAAKVAEMASVIIGGSEELRRKPIVALYAEPVSPLVLDKDATRNFLDFVERGLPTVFLGSPNGGLTAPITLAGLLTLNNAETLAGIVLGQITRPGTPMVYGGGTTVMDVQTGEPAVGSPELCLTASASAQLARFYGMPSWGHAGLSDSRDVDAQAVMEAEFSIMTTAFSGQNLIHDLGFMETTLSYSPELLVICNEIVGKVDRFLRGIDVSNETVAFNVIERVGTGNSFLSDKHTLAHVHSELFFPKLAVHRPYSEWVKEGRIGMMKRASKEVREILTRHEPQELEPGISADLAKIIRDVEKNE